MQNWLNKGKFLALTLLLLTSAGVTIGSQEDYNKVLPEQAGTFRRRGPFELKQDNVVGDELEAKIAYVTSNGARLNVSLFRLPQDGRAYERLTTTAQSLREKEPVQINSTVGTAGFVTSRLVGFFKGAYFVKIEVAPGSRASTQDAVALATELAAYLERGEGEIPVLIKHLPNWEQAQQTAVYLNRFRSLDAVAKDSVLGAIDSEGDADAVSAKYGSSRVLVIEFNTPQRAAENDRRVTAKIQELWSAGQPAPSAYRRVGNYAVFVFDAPDEQTAKQLMDQVKYEQVVSWLGENPNIFKAAERHYVETTLGVLVAVLKASGFALIGCLATGGLLGALLFFRRRAQQRTVEAFSDAGGMLRLNLDEMTAETNPARLISRQ